MDEIWVIDDLEETRKKNVKAIESLLLSQDLDKCVKVVPVDDKLMNELSRESKEQNDEEVFSVEEKVGQYLIKKRDIKLIVVDRDLHKYDSDIRSESTITEGALLAAVPVCGYSRKSRAVNPGGRLSRLAESVATPMIDIPKEPEKLARRVVEIYCGNKTISEKMIGIGSTPNLSKAVSILLGREDQLTYFANYQLTLPVRKGLLDLTDQEGPDSKLLLAYIMGLWLYKFILKFPGILLNSHAAAAYLNLKEKDFAEHRSLFEDFEYKGPFSLFSSYWWRYDLDDALIEENIKDGVEYIRKHKGSDVKPLDESGEEQAFCIVTEKIIPFTQSIRPPMVPDGADLARMDRSTAEKWQMYLP